MQFFHGANVLKKVSYFVLILLLKISILSYFKSISVKSILSVFSIQFYSNFSCYADASEKIIGAVIQQVVEEQTQPLVFYCRRTTRAESWYSTYDLELISIYSAITHFQHMLEGRSFKIFTDQKTPHMRVFEGEGPCVKSAAKPD